MQEPFSKPISQSEMEQIISDGETEFRTEPPDDTEALERLAKEWIFEHGVEEGQLSPKKREVLNEVRIFLADMFVSFGKDMTKLIEQYNQSQPDVLTSEIMAKMLDKGYNLPLLDIYDQEAADNFMNDVTPELCYPADWPNSFIVSFNLPEPVVRFWDRGGLYYWGTGQKSVPETTIQWGYLYRAIMDAVWAKIGESQCDGRLIINRLNQCGKHSPYQYYYVWQIGPSSDHWKNEEEEN